MDLPNRAAHDRVLHNYGHNYGQTMVQDDAQNIQGDVNISHDLHIHLHSQLDTLAGAGSVVGLLHIANTLLSLKQSLQDVVSEK